MNSDTFLEDLNTYLDADVDDDVIDEVKNARISVSDSGSRIVLPEETMERLREWVRTNEAFDTTLRSEAFRNFMYGEDNPASKSFQKFMYGPGNPASNLDVS